VSHVGHDPLLAQANGDAPRRRGLAGLTGACFGPAAVA